jgi:hypothetical protein
MVDGGTLRQDALQVVPGAHLVTDIMLGHPQQALPQHYIVLIRSTEGQLMELLREKM